VANLGGINLAIVRHLSRLADAVGESARANFARIVRALRCSVRKGGVNWGA
jgi:hypothetical protein